MVNAVCSFSFGSKRIGFNLCYLFLVVKFLFFLAPNVEMIQFDEFIPLTDITFMEYASYRATDIYTFFNGTGASFKMDIKRKAH